MLSLLSQFARLMKRDLQNTKKETTPLQLYTFWSLRNKFSLVLTPIYKMSFS